MEYRPFGQTGLQVSAIGFGCWELGGGYGKVDESEYTPAVHRAIDLGINCFDTAEAYGFGVSERALARALGERRQDVMVVTKFGVGYQEAAPSFRDSSRQRLMDSIEKSLSNLNTDYVDVYMVHWPDIRTPFDETMRAFDDIVLQGKARFVGISNLRLQQLETCMQTRRIDVVQYCWNMLDRRMSKDIYPYCHEHNIGVMAYGSLAYGMLTGTFTAQMEFDAGDWRRQRGRMGAINLFQHLFAPEHFPRRRDRCLIKRDELLDRHPANRLSDNVQRHVFELPKPHARLAHVQLLAGLGPRFAKPGIVLRVAVNAHEINAHVILLRCQPPKRQRLRGIAVISRQGVSPGTRW